MKNLKNYLLLSALSLALFSCNRDDSDDYSATDKNNVTVNFKNIIDGSGDITLGTTVVTSSSNQKHNFSTLKYIVSNFVLVKTDGSEVKYNYDNPDKGAFVIDQNGATEQSISLADIQAGDYKQIKFGLGISPNAYTLGQTGQAAFWDTCVSTGMSWQWASGYKFAKIEGSYAAPGTDIPATGASTYKFHSGNIANPTTTNTPDVYKVVTLDLPTTMKVRNNVAPKVHLTCSMNKWLSGTKTLVLDATNEVSMSPNLVLIQDGSTNLAGAFKATSVN